MVDWAPNTARVVDNGFGESRFGNTIQGAIIHHVAGYNGLKFVTYSNPRNSHPTYHIANDGTVTGIVHPSRRPYSTAASVDEIAITFEIDNEQVGGDWRISDLAMNSLITTLAYHGLYSDRNGFAINIRGKNQSEFFIGWHQQYVNTECPGPYVIRNIPYIVGQLNGNTTPAPRPNPAPAPANEWVRAPGGESGAPLWPVGPLMARVQRALANRNPTRYVGIIDGVGGPLTAKGIQETLNVSRTNGGVRGYRRTPVDGALGINNAYGVQYYAMLFGEYDGPQDGDPRTESWANFALGLERP